MKRGFVVGLILLMGAVVGLQAVHEGRGGRPSADSPNMLYVRSPEAMLRLTAAKIARLIYPVSFYRVKARTIRAISTEIRDRFGGQVPHRLEDLLTLPGVGRKTANIVVTLAFRRPGIAVDTHVHRISNRLGYVSTRNADETEMALRGKLPRRYWIVFNDLLVALGQNVCRPVSPHCSVCPIEMFCDRVAVGRSR